MNINVTVRLESPELMAAILALAEALPQINLGARLPIREEVKLDRRITEKESVKEEEEIVEDKEKIVQASASEQGVEQAAASVQVMSEKVVEAEAEKIPVNAVKEAEAQKTPANTVDIDDVRAKLLILSQAGKQKEVKALINKFGGNKLTEISKENYQQMLIEATQLLMELKGAAQLLN